MIANNDERRHREADLVAARAREDRSRAARDAALTRAYMRPDLAGPSIDRFYKNEGLYALRDRLSDEARSSAFGIGWGNPFTREGRAARAEANEARRDLPDLWDSHAQDRKNRDAIERAYAEQYGPQQEQDNAAVWPQPEMQDRQGMAVTVELLVERAEGLEESIEQIDSQIERALQGLAAGKDDAAQTLEIIAERRKTQLERMFELGETHAQIEELENRIQEHDEREHGSQGQERKEAVPVQEDYLDWWRSPPDARAPDQSEDEQYQREGREPEDYLDWWKR